MIRKVIVMAKSATRKTDDAVTTADGSRTMLTDAAANVTTHDIARRAYDLYLAAAASTDMTWTTGYRQNATCEERDLRAPCEGGGPRLHGSTDG